MTFRKSIAAAPIAALALALLAAVPAQAAITTFATSDPAAPAANLYFQSGPVTGVPGSTGALFSISLPGATEAGPSNASFSFVNLGIAGLVTDQPAVFNLNATTTGAALPTVGLFQQSGLSGTFSFTNSAPIVIGESFFATGSNLLSATFTNASILGVGSDATFSSSPGSVSFVSDFVDFGGTTGLQFAFSLGDIAPELGISGQGSALDSFAATGSGSFSSDPAPTPVVTVAAVPEPATWAMMIAGFGMAGLGLRRAKKAPVAAR